jgi:vacuolar protein sorting-associated protein 29
MIFGSWLTKFRKLLTPGKIGQVICLGNVTDKPTLELLQGISPDYQAVKGEYDMSPSLPLNKVVTHGQLRIGFVAGHSVIPNSDPDSLLITARQLDVDMLIWGGSHRVEAYQLEGKFFVSPGSATGAFSTGWPVEDEEGAGEEAVDKEQSNDETAENGEHDEDQKDDDEPIPSFCLLDIQGAVCVLYIYSLIDGEVKVDKVSYRKDMQ